MKLATDGLYYGEHVRAEAVDEGFAAQVMLRDCGALLGCRIGIYEFCAHGHWTGIGTYSSVEAVATLAARLREGTHAYRATYSDGVGCLPGQVIPFGEALPLIAERLDAESSRSAEEVRHAR